jgi:phage-related protein
MAVKFFRTQAGNEPVREWLRALSQEEKKTIGEDIKTAQFGWPLGMPLVRKLERDLWEIRIPLGPRIARILLTIDGDLMILLHGFIKKSTKIPPKDLELAKRRLKVLQEQK